MRADNGESHDRDDYAPGTSFGLRRVAGVRARERVIDHAGSAEPRTPLARGRRKPQGRWRGHRNLTMAARTGTIASGIDRMAAAGWPKEMRDEAVRILAVFSFCCCKPAAASRSVRRTRSLIGRIPERLSYVARRGWHIRYRLQYVGYPSTTCFPERANLWARGTSFWLRVTGTNLVARNKIFPGLLAALWPGAGNGACDRACGGARGGVWERAHNSFEGQRRRGTGSAGVRVGFLAEGERLADLVRQRPLCRQPICRCGT